MPLDSIADTLPASVEAEINFLDPIADKPYSYIGDPPEGVPPIRGEYSPKAVRVENVRSIADRLSLDVEGIAVVHSPTDVQDLWDEAQTLAIGHPEVAALVRQVTGASRVVVFDHTRRRRAADAPDPNVRVPQEPVGRAHVDQTIWSGPNRVREVMGRQAEALLKGRAAIINVWRPIGHAARDWPLAVGDARSIAREELVATDLIFPHRRGEIYSVAHGTGQRWLYVPDLGPDEAILLKCWDSDEHVARFAPHTGFADPTTPPGTPPRESIEFRTIAFWDPPAQS